MIIVEAVSHLTLQQATQCALTFKVNHTWAVMSTYFRKRLFLEMSCLNVLSGFLVEFFFTKFHELRTWRTHFWYLQIFREVLFFQMDLYFTRIGIFYRALRDSFPINLHSNVHIKDTFFGESHLKNESLVCNLSVSSTWAHIHSKFSL